MPRYKQFHGSGSELEKAVNSWLDEFEPDVTQMAQTVDGNGSVVLGFVYEESFRGQERRLDTEHGMSKVKGPSSPEAVMPEDSVQVRINPPEQADPSTA
ncbi:MAG TPA: hypothetical protein DEV93_05330 [Chloroflexi bacterium]|jgi:hypothetical protein|nr:hypothetical protein [Chloroflexota bacterium]